MKSKKNYFIRKTEKLLGELDAYRNSLDYLTSVRNTADLPPRKAEIRKKRVHYLTHTIGAVDCALGLLSPIERTVIEGLYLHRAPEGALEEVCEACGLERSSVYRHRARALKKLAAALYGEGEVV